MIWVRVETAAAAQDWFVSLFEAQPADARIRYIAGEIVSDLEQPSCAALGVPPGFDRAKALAPEIAAVEEFKQRIRGSPAYFHFAVGEADQRHEDKMRSGCWNDSETRLAELHVKDAKKSTKVHLDALSKLLPEVTQPANFAVATSPEAAVEFRFRVRELIESSRPRCTLTRYADNEAVSAPAKVAVTAFRRELNGTQYALQFDMAEGDVNLYRAISTVECDEEGTEPPSYWAQKLSLSVETQIKTIRTIMRPFVQRATEAPKP